MSKNLRKAIGSLMVVGLGGAALTSMERAWLRLIGPSGIILFRRNIEDARQTRALLKDATALCADNAFRCVDVEGGTVDRLREALAPMPSAQAVAKTGNAARMREHGELIARSIQAFGFNTTLAPVLDLALPTSVQVMGTRSVSATPEGVIEYAQNFLAGLAAHGVTGCGKHFPGLGGGTLDSHLATPSIERNWNELWHKDIAPYRALYNLLPMIMVSHAAYPQTPGKDKPASASSFWITNVLRKRLKYKGLIFSDDLEMGGILNFLPIAEAAIATIRAGIDLIEICHSAELILGCYESLLREGERSASFHSLLLNRAVTVRRHRAKLFSASPPPALTQKQFDALRTRILRFSERIKKETTA